MNFSPRVQLNLQTMLCLLSDHSKVCILFIPLTIRPHRGMWRNFSCVATSFLGSNVTICTLFQARLSSYQVNVARQLGPNLYQKVTSGKPSKPTSRSYYLGDLMIMLRSYCFQFFLGLLFLDLIELLLIDHLQFKLNPNFLKSTTPLMQSKN